MKKIKVVCTILLVLSCMVGCVSPLHSSDPAIRKEAIKKITDDKELFFIAMNICVRQKTRLCPGEYLEDVRVMAVNQIKDPAYLICCASWSDGDLYADAGANNFYKGKPNYGNCIYYNDPRVKVSHGDAVRFAAKKRLSCPDMFRSSARCFDPFHLENLLPSYGGLYRSKLDNPHYNKPNNPIDRLFKDIIAEQASLDDLVRFVYNSWGAGVVPNAYVDAVRKLNGISSEDAIRLLKIFCIRLANISKVDNRDRSEHMNMSRDCLRQCLWLIYQYIEDPNEEVVVLALKECFPEDVVKILSKVKQQEIFLKIFGEEDLVFRGERKDGERKDFKLGVAKEILKPVVREDVLESLALKARLYSIRYAAIDKLTAEDMLSKVAHDAMNNCPIDISIKGCGFFDDERKWASEAVEKSAIQLRSLAINKMKDPVALRTLRKADKSIAIRKNVTERLQALGFSDVDEIIECDKYGKDLFLMLAGIKSKEEFIKIAKNAKLKGVRLLAASKLESSDLVGIVQKETLKNTSKPEKGQLVFGGYYLGMSIAEMLAKLMVEEPTLEPIIYLDDNVLCIADKTGRDVAKANVDDISVYWITLPFAVVKNIVGFESGTFNDLECAIESRIGISFGYDVISKGEVSQKIGNFENIAGETLRFFKSDLSKGEDLARSVRKSMIYNSAVSTLNVSDMLGAIVLGALENDSQQRENNANACNPMFQQQGAVQLLYTRDAVRGSFGATGTQRKSFSSVLGNTLKSAVNAN